MDCGRAGFGRVVSVLLRGRQRQRRRRLRSEASAAVPGRAPHLVALPAHVVRWHGLLRHRAMRVLVAVPAPVLRVLRVVAVDMAARHVVVLLHVHAWDPGGERVHVFQESLDP